MRVRQLLGRHRGDVASPLGGLGALVHVLHITFPDFTVPELERIGALMAAALGYRLSPDADVALADYLRHRVGRPWFAWTERTN